MSTLLIADELRIAHHRVRPGTSPRDHMDKCAEEVKLEIAEPVVHDRGWSHSQGQSMVCSPANHFPR